MKATLTIAALLGSLILGTSAVSAQTKATMAGLQVEVAPGVGALVRADVEAAIAPSFDDSTMWRYLDHTNARQRLTPVVRDCFTQDCLAKAAEATGALAGLQVQFSGESQIYDWSIDIWDLAGGQRIAGSKGACELCGRTEVVREFRRTLGEALAAANPPAPARQATSTPPGDTPPRQLEEPPAPQEPVAADAPPTLAMIEISVVPTDAAIFVNDKEVGAGQMTLSFEPGTYDVRFAREGYQGFAERLTIGPDGASGTTRMRVHLAKTDPDPVLVAPAEGPIDSMEPADRKLYGLITAGVGASLIGVGMYLAAIDGDPVCDDGAFSDCPELYDTGGAAVVSTMSGAVLLTGGLALVAWNLLSGGAEPETAVSPTVGDGNVGLTLHHRF